jgi:hypothetical protein
MLDEREDQIQDLVSQLKDSNKIARQIKKRPDFHLNKEDLEQFIINNSGRLIEDCMGVLDEVRELVTNAPDAESMEGLSELMKATTGAIETLNKIHLQDKKTIAAATLKRMDIEGKKEVLRLTDSGAINGERPMTRDEVMDLIFKNQGDITDIEAITVEEATDE